MAIQNSLTVLCSLVATLIAPKGLSLQDTASPKSVIARPHVEAFSGELAGGSGGLEVDSNGFVYCADFGSRLGTGSTGGNRVYRLDPKTGQAEVFISSLRGASGNAFGPNGDLFQSSIGAGFITRIKPDGSSSIFVNKELASPVGIAIDDEGMLFVANCGSNKIVEVSPDGEPLVFASDPLLSCPNGITFDDEHNLYVANFNNGDVIKISWDGDVSKLATLPGNNNGHLVHRAGFLYVVARGAHQIYKVSLKGDVELFAGTGKRGHHDGPALEATFSFPNDLAFSPDGKTLYVNENASTTEPHTSLAPMLVRRIRMPG